MQDEADRPEATSQDGPVLPSAAAGPHPLIEALRFLTVLPIGPATAAPESGIARSLAWFPVAGLLIGLLLLPVGWLAGLAWDAGVRAACIIVAWGMITAGMHLDGLGDTFDAVMSWRARERKLEILRDSRIGTMGLLAIGAVLLLKFAWLQASGDAWWRAVLLAPVWGRWSQIYGLCRFPSARAEGLGHTFQQQIEQRSLFRATLAALLVTLLLGPIQGLVAGLLVWGIAALLYRWWVRDLGGLTGDTYGALCEISEVIVLAVIAL